MNTKSAVFVMIGLLGMPAVYNATKSIAEPKVDAHRYSVVALNSWSRSSKWEPGTNEPRALIIDNKTGWVTYVCDGVSKRENGEAYWTTNKMTLWPKEKLPD